MSTPERLEAILHAVAEHFKDVEVLKTVARREGRAYALSVTVDRDGGVDTELCERITRFIDQRVEAEKFDTPLGPYTIEVGSAGLDRPLLTPAHYRRFAGREARIITSLRVYNRVEFTWKIEAADEDKVTLEDRYAGRVDVPYAAIKRANLVYDPADDLRRHKA